DAEPLVRKLLPAQVDERGAGRADLDDEQGWIGELRAADLVHTDHYEIGIELGLRAEHDGRLGYDAKVFGTDAAQDAVQPSRHDLVNCRWPGAHDERSVQQFIPAAVIGHLIQLGDGERAAGGGPGLGDRHDTHGAPLLCMASTLAVGYDIPGLARLLQRAGAMRYS